jgi:hypothetical protein
MKTETLEYRGRVIAKRRGRFVVLSKDGKELEAHTTLAAAKAQIDRLLDPVDISFYGCPI